MTTPIAGTKVKFSTINLSSNLEPITVDMEIVAVDRERAILTFDVGIWMTFEAFEKLCSPTHAFIKPI
jgi:hypothetical protein